MLANQASSTPPTTAASSDQVMQDGGGSLWTSLGQAPALQMAWRRLPAFRVDMERRSAVMSLIVVLPVRRANESPNCLCWRRSSSITWHHPPAPFRLKRNSAKSRYDKGTIRGEIWYLEVSKDVRRHRLISIDYLPSLLSGYKPNRISWLELSSNSDWESNASNTCKMGTFSRLVMLKICRIW